MNLAVVVARFGAGVCGGAESQARQLALALAAHHHVEIFTFGSATARDHVCREDGLQIHRYRPDPPPARLATLLSRLAAIAPGDLVSETSPVTARDEHLFWTAHLNSRRMISDLTKRDPSFHLFLVLPYPFAFAKAVVERFGHKTLLVPCLHRESYAFLAGTRDMLAGARWIGWNSLGERRLAVELFSQQVITNSSLLGEGVELEASEWSAIGPLRCPVQQRFFLYVGKVCVEKGVGELLAAWQLVQPRISHQLILVGAPDQRLKTQLAAAGVIVLGLQSNQVRDRLLRHCTALIQPSHNESYSRVIYEAWSYAKPVVVAADCAATADEVQRDDPSKGLLFQDSAQLATVLAELATMPAAERLRRGRAGRGHALKAADWPSAIARYLSCIAHVASFAETPLKPRSLPSVAHPRRRAWLRLTRGPLRIGVFGDTQAIAQAVARHHIRCEDFDPTQAYDWVVITRSLDPHEKNLINAARRSDRTAVLDIAPRGKSSYISKTELNWVGSQIAATLAAPATYGQQLEPAGEAVGSTNI